MGVAWVVIHSTSVKTRFSVSVGLNALRAIISFATGLIIARALEPTGYGDLMFLLGSFVALRSLLDLGSSNAFFTFLSQRTRGKRFYLTYFFWLAFQFVLTVLLLWLIIPSALFEKIWVGHDRDIALLAFVSAFMQQQVWQAVGQIGESMRKTIKVQLLNFAVSLVYLAVILFVSLNSQLSIKKILFVLIGQYVVATVFAYRILNIAGAVSIVEEKPLIDILCDYWKYCKPLAALALFNFLYIFGDKWMLQRFGGATQQGYFQISNQFATVSLLATTSILNVFWKEIANAWEKQDRARVAMLYRKVSRGLVMFGAIISGFLVPWSEHIVNVFLGAAYTNAWPVLAIMLLYPIHQSMGQISGTMFLASGQTRSYMFLSITMMLLSLYVTYLVLAPASDKWVSGFEMGALGMAYKMVLLGLVSVNIQSWILARIGGWKFDWAFQVVGIPLVITFGFIAKMLAGMLWNAKNTSIDGLMIQATITGMIYFITVVVLIYELPWLIGAEREEVRKLFRLKR